MMDQTATERGERRSKEEFFSKREMRRKTRHKREQKRQGQKTRSLNTQMTSVLSVIPLNQFIALNNLNAYGEKA